MTDLEDRLRAMLDERAADVRRPPTLDLGIPEPPLHPLEPVAGAREPLHRRPLPWLLSAAAVVLALLTTVAVIGGPGANHDGQPAGTRSGSASPTGPTSSRPAPGPRAAVALGLLAPGSVDGFEVTIRASEPGYRWVGWHRDGDPAQPSGSDTGGELSAQAVAYDPGAFPSAVLNDPQPVVLTGPDGRVDATRGSMLPLEQQASSTVRLVPTIVWQYAPNARIAVQALTSVVNGGDLTTLAAAVRPGHTTAVTLPFRLSSAVPDRLTSIVDSRPNYPLVLRFGDVSARLTEIAVQPPRGVRPDLAAATERSIGGLPGYVSPVGGGYVEYAGGSVTVYASDNGTLDVSALNRLLAGLRWTGGDGSGTPVPLREAFPR